MRSRLILFGAAILAGPAAAQDAAPQPACELHVWPAAGLTSVRQRGFESAPSAGALNGLIKRAQEASAEKSDARAAENLAAPETPKPLSTARQVEVLTELPLPTMLGLPAYRLIVHGSALDSHTIRTVKTRYTASEAPCYADLVLDDVVYSREYARGQNLKTFFRFRDFAAQSLPVRSFGTWVETKLRVFSIDPPNLGPAALDEIASALRSNATAFSGLLSKRP